ncbi:15239_t:CDS:1 [Acaulospora morrowiae]|uniref:15239_t:CDS:1 n=1 Tax=Acaulospora morrowiae TaxID=94023 RepID=A0A9N8ZGM8_9GLOM|nr:15239_t:CDS:1 [Acaulospora morrowiae]
MDIARELIRFFNDKQIEQAIGHFQQGINKGNEDYRWKKTLSALREERRSRLSSDSNKEHKKVENKEWIVTSWKEKADTQKKDEWIVERITDEQCREAEVMLQEIRKGIKTIGYAPRDKKIPSKKQYQEKWSIAGQWCKPCKSRSEDHHAHTYCTKCDKLSDRARHPFVDKCICKDKGVGRPRKARFFESNEKRMI